LPVTVVGARTYGRTVQARSGELPRITNEDIRNEEQLTAFVTSFINKDFQASTLLNPSNVALFAQGYRPKIGLPYDPEASGQKFADLQKYFIRKIFLDLKSIEPLNLTFRASETRVFSSLIFDNLLKFIKILKKYFYQKFTILQLFLKFHYNLSHQ
jgi:hypothetical protein